MLLFIYFPDSVYDGLGKYCISPALPPPPPFRHSKGRAGDAPTAVDARDQPTPVVRTDLLDLVAQLPVVHVRIVPLVPRFDLVASHEHLYFFDRQEVRGGDAHGRHR